MFRSIVGLSVFAVLVSSASGGLTIGTTETFPIDGATWGVGGPDGWQVDIFKGFDAKEDNYQNNQHREFFGSTGQLLLDSSDGRKFKGQPDPGSKSADGSGTLAVQHLAIWNGAAPPDPDPLATCTQLKYITLPATAAGVTYTLSGWVNTVLIQHNSNPPGWDGKHPRVVDHGNPPMLAQFPDVQIGLKNGLASADDLETQPYIQPVLGLVDNMLGGAPNPNAWVPFTASAVGDGGPLTILLRVAAPDITSGAIDDGRCWDADVRFDDILLTPEPTTLALLAIGLAGLMRRRRSS
ncbi:MAG: hypothetical protein AMXMBFR13_39630 [Phycisphaerae bacterium]